MTRQAPPPAPNERLRSLGSRWTAAAADAFAGMAASPERYLAASRLVAAWLDHLRALPSETEGRSETEGPSGTDGDNDDEAATALISAWETRESRSADIGAGLPLTAAERATLTVAAFAIRYGEVADRLSARARRRALADAAAGPGGWVVLDESGDPVGDPFVSYQRLEAEAATGRGVLVQTRPDESFTGVIHEVHPVLVDPETGELSADYYESSCEFKSMEEREEQVAAIRADPGRLPGKNAG